MTSPTPAQELRKLAMEATPWRLEQPDKWPFDIVVLNSRDEEVLRETRFAYSTSDKSVSDVMACRAFRDVERDGAVKGNADQVAKVVSMIAAVNAFPALLDAREDARKTAMDQAAELVRTTLEDIAVYHEVAVKRGAKHFDREDTARSFRAVAADIDAKLRALATIDAGGKL